MARRTALQADETRMSIIRAAGRVFCAAGFAGTTLEEIARNAGVTRGAVYWHFENKHNVLENVCQAAALLFEDAFRAGAGSSPFHALAATAEAFFLTVADQHPARQISALLFKLGEAGSSEIIRAKRVALSVRLRTYAGDRLELAVKTGLLPATFDILPATLAYEAYVFGVLESWLIAPSFDLIARAKELACKAVGLVRS